MNGKELQDLVDLLKKIFSDISTIKPDAYNQEEVFSKLKEFSKEELKEGLMALRDEAEETSKQYSFCLSNTQGQVKTLTLQELIDHPHRDELLDIMINHSSINEMTLTTKEAANLFLKRFRGEELTEEDEKVLNVLDNLICSNDHFIASCVKLIINEHPEFIAELDAFLTHLFEHSKKGQILDEDTMIESMEDVLMLYLFHLSVVLELNGKSIIHSTGELFKCYYIGDYKSKENIVALEKAIKASGLSEKFGDISKLTTETAREITDTISDEELDKITEKANVNLPDFDAQEKELSKKQDAIEEAINKTEFGSLTDYQKISALFCMLKDLFKDVRFLDIVSAYGMHSNIQPDFIIDTLYDYCKELIEKRNGSNADLNEILNKIKATSEVSEAALEKANELNSAEEKAAVTKEDMMSMDNDL